MKSQAFARMAIFPPESFRGVGDLFACGKASIHAPARSGGTCFNISAATTGGDKCADMP